LKWHRSVYSNIVLYYAPQIPAGIQSFPVEWDWNLQKLHEFHWNGINSTRMGPESAGMNRMKKYLFMN